MWHSRRIKLYRARLVLVLAMIASMWFTWFCASVVDVDIHNFDHPEQIATWNMFK